MSGPLPNGIHGALASFQWKTDYDKVLTDIAQTNDVNTKWDLLSSIIKYKISQNVSQFLSNQSEPSIVTTASEPTNPPAPESLVPSTPQGLIIPPFPARPPNKDGPNRFLSSRMEPAEAAEYQDRVFSLLDGFEEGAPFTIQRVCELCVAPTTHYKTIGKYLRALERALLVTSTWDDYPAIEFDDKSAPGASSTNTLKVATTPLFTPIPFLHEDARKSPSPASSPILGATTRPPPSLGSVDPQEPRGLGLVDELDDPKPGHMADHPTPLTAGASVTPPAPLAERFVKASSPEAGGANEGKNEDDEVEDMVLDDAEEDEKQGKS